MRQVLSVELGCIHDAYDMLPLVRDKDILDNIIYSGITASVPQSLLEDPEREDGP